MEDLSPTLVLIFEIRAALEGGQSLREGVNRFLQLEKRDFALNVAEWIHLMDHQMNPEQIYSRLPPSRRALLQFLERGLAGLPIQSALLDFEKEIIASCEVEMDRHVRMMPIKLLMPLLFLLFPAYLVLLFGSLLAVLVNTQ